MRIVRTFKDSPSAYSSFCDVPDELKLYNYQEQFVGEDVWRDYLESQYPEGMSDDRRKDIYRVESAWKRFCNENNCHHALPSPSLFDKWGSSLLNRMQPQSAKRNYFTVIYRFLRFLMWHIDYPHCYNPLLFAVEEYDTVQRIWNAAPYPSSHD